MTEAHNGIILCIYQRRFDEFNALPDFEGRMIRQFHWVKHFIGKGITVFFVLGADKNEKIESSIGNIFLIKDRRRTTRFSHSRQFYKNTSRLIKKEGTTHLICQGLNDGVSHTFLSFFLNKNIAIIYQDHASRYKKTQLLFKPFFKVADCVTFNSKGQEDAWTQHRIFPTKKVRYLPEGTSKFEIDNEQRLTQLQTAEQIKLLWLGNLNQRKDPITVLEALSKTITKSICLTMIFKENELFDRVNEFIHSNKISNQVELVGYVKHQDIVRFFNSHHFIISASHREGSGYAVIEALSCGLVPILTRIPSFLDFSKNGSRGFLFDCGDSEELAEIFNEINLSNYRELSEASHEHYEQRFSARATADRLLSILKEFQ